MAHGTPDWGLQGDKKTTYGSDDMHELAVRLGAIESYDRRGEVVWHDDFRSGLGAWGYAWGVGVGLVTPICSPIRSSPLAMYMRTDPAVDGYSFIDVKLSRLVLGGIGLEYSFATDANLATFAGHMVVYNGVYRVNYIFQYVHTTGELQVRVFPGAWQTIATVAPVYTNVLTFCTVKYVVDTVNQHYVRLIFNDVEYDVSAYVSTVVADVTAPRVHIILWNISSALAGNVTVVDDVILTQNEPLDILV
jgi:hypothetical protein